jgi:hypothetical protein
MQTVTTPRYVCDETLNDDIFHKLIYLIYGIQNISRMTPLNKEIEIPAGGTYLSSEMLIMHGILIEMQGSFFLAEDGVRQAHMAVARESGDFLVQGSRCMF